MNTSPADRDIAVTVAEMLKEAGVSQKAASEQTGIARATLIRRLAGSSFTLSELRALAELLGVDIADILARASGGAAA